mmetsp:Transcript_39001/g.89600  ORF Transcript_39001/g.89600 Transcript_39001/m.89600 type:complete len:235 (+) Transcript_39001:163-867(+)
MARTTSGCLATTKAAGEFAPKRRPSPRASLSLHLALGLPNVAAIRADTTLSCRLCSTSESLGVCSITQAGRRKRSRTLPSSRENSTCTSPMSTRLAFVKGFTRHTATLLALSSKRGTKPTVKRTSRTCVGLDFVSLLLDLGSRRVLMKLPRLAVCPSSCRMELSKHLRTSFHGHCSPCASITRSGKSRSWTKPLQPSLKHVSRRCAASCSAFGHVFYGYDMMARTLHCPDRNAC